jgi:hypothetical protein
VRMTDGAAGNVFADAAPVVLGLGEADNGVWAFFFDRVGVISTTVVG